MLSTVNQIEMINSENLKKIFSKKVHEIFEAKNNITVHKLA